MVNNVNYWFDNLGLFYIQMLAQDTLHRQDMLGILDPDRFQVTDMQDTRGGQSEILKCINSLAQQEFDFGICHTLYYLGRPIFVAHPV